MPKKEPTESIVAVKRAVAILNLLAAAGEPLGVSTIAEQLGLPKVTTFRILSTLVEEGMLRKSPADDYSLGLIFIQYGDRVASKLSLTSLLSPELDRLRDETGESVNLGIHSENHVLSIYSAQGESSMLMARLNALSPLYCSAMGKVFLFSLSEDGARRYYQSEPQARTANTITTYEGFLAERERYRAAGITCDAEEYEYGLTCIAAPVFGAKESPVAAISISGPTSRIKLKGMEALASKLTAVAESASATLKMANYNHSE